jgi:hypothetical protein
VDFHAYRGYGYTHKRGIEPLWLSTIMRYYIQPVVKRLGIKKRVTWHTFRRTYTTLLHANGEDVKVVQELLRHNSSRITMDIYAQAQMPANWQHSRKWWRWCGRRHLRWGQNDGLTAPREKRGVSNKSFVLLASPTGFEPVLSP